MGTKVKKKVSRTYRKCRHCPVTRHSAVLGLVSDLLTIIKLLCRLLSWPVRQAAHYIHRALRTHPALRWRHTHATLCIIIGVSVLLLSWALESLFKHPVWSVTIETMRAAGVCPIWETMAAMMKLGAEFE